MLFWNVVLGPITLMPPASSLIMEGCSPALVVVVAILAAAAAASPSQGDMQKDRRQQTHCWYSTSLVERMPRGKTRNRLLGPYWKVIVLVNTKETGGGNHGRTVVGMPLVI